MLTLDLRDELEGKTPEETKKHLKLFYDSAYKSGTYKPINSYGAWMRLFKYFSPFVNNKKPFKKCLEVGCGIGLGVSFANMMGHDTWGMDLGNASFYWKQLDIGDKCVIADASYMPFKDNEFDFILCADVMEHIQQEEIINVFKEIRRVGSKFYFYIIHTSIEAQPLKLIRKNEEVKIYTHITQRSPGWWANKLTESDYGNIDFTIADNHVIFICSKNKEDYKEWRN